MAFHAAQGPQLGLPQMIQSRPQFGYVGALLVWLFAYLQYAGFNIFNTILAGDSLHATVHGPAKLWIVVATVLAAFIALIGYDLIHRVERWLTARLPDHLRRSSPIAVFLLPYPAGSFDLGGFKATPFLIQFGAVAGYQISWAIYVSDYSRYLPPTVGIRRTFLWTYWRLGARRHLADVPGRGAGRLGGRRASTPSRSLQAAGDRVFHGFGGDRAGVRHARAGLGDRAEHVRRLAHADQRGRLVPQDPPDQRRYASSRRCSPRCCRSCRRC